MPGSHFSGVLRCLGADAWVAIELEDADDWAVMCSFLERPDLELRETGPTRELRGSMRQALEEWAGTVSAFQATLALQKAGLAAGAVQDSEDLWRDAQLRSRGAFVEVCHPDLGCIEYPDAPSRSLGGVRFRAPRLGEDTADVLGEWLACGEGELDELRASGAIWMPDRSEGWSPR